MGTVGTVGTEEKSYTPSCSQCSLHKREVGTANPMEKFEVPDVPSVPTKKKGFLEKVCDFHFKGANLQSAKDISNRGPNQLKVMSKSDQSIGTATKK